jgi:hypothetical protein
VQLSPPSGAAPTPTDVAGGLTAALAARGPQPAVTVLRPDRRDEQGVASLAQWAAKGAHLLEAELLLGPGHRLHLEAPPAWPLAAVCLAAWWAGIAIDLDADAEVAVVHEDRSAPEAEDVLWLGDGVDGGPRPSDDGPPGEAWPVAVQSWPDAPPPPGAGPDVTALIADGRRWTQRELLADAAAIGTGRLGVDASSLDPVSAVLAVAARPIATPHPTVVLAGVDRAAADGEQVRTWWP